MNWNNSPYLTLMAELWYVLWVQYNLYKKKNHLKVVSNERWFLTRNKIKKERLECLRSEIPPAAPWLPILVIHIRSQVKTRQSQSYKFKKNAKNSNFEILRETLHATHPMKLLDKKYKYEMDPTRTVGATEQTRDAGRTDGRTEWNQYTPPPTTLLYNKHDIKTEPEK